MKKYIYNIYDTVAKNWLDCCLVCGSDGEYIRKIMQYALQFAPLKDLKPMRLAQFDEEQYIGKFDSATVDWTAYKFPETKADNLAEVGLSNSSAISKFEELNENSQKEIIKKE